MVVIVKTLIEAFLEQAGRIRGDYVLLAAVSLIVSYLAINGIYKLVGLCMGKLSI
jgi:hypothetical protein